MTDEDLLTYLTGNREQQEIALKHLYFHMGAEIGRFFRSQGVDKAEAEDLLQETILKVLRRASTYRGDGQFISWVWQVARNCLADHRRSRQSQLEDTTADPAELVDANPNLWLKDEQDSSRQVEECVSKGLTRFATEEPRRAYAVGLLVDGVGCEEIGIRIGRTYDATRQYLMQCRKQLAPFISHCLDMLPS